MTEIEYTTIEGATWDDVQDGDRVTAIFDGGKGSDVVKVERPVPKVELPTEEGYYRERYDNGTLGRIWVLDDEGLWDAPEGDSAEFGRWPLYRLYTLADAAEIIADWLDKMACPYSAEIVGREFVDGAK